MGLMMQMFSLEPLVSLPLRFAGRSREGQQKANKG
jgi:hypothetical protein